jgi:urease accessory protein
VQQGRVTNRSQFEEFLRTALHCGIKRTDAIAVALAYKAAFGVRSEEARSLAFSLADSLQSIPSVASGASVENRDAISTRLKQIVELDNRLTAMKLPRESRQGSIQIGKQFLRNAGRLFTHEAINAYADCIQSGECAGHYSVAYGLTTAVVGISLRMSLEGYLHAFVVGQVSAAIRLIPLGAMEGQMTIQAMRSDLIEIAAFALTARMEDLGGFTPGLDIRSMQHERLYSRLFIS